MLNYTSKLKLAPEKEAGSAPAEEQKPNASANSPADETPGDNTDEYGYAPVTEEKAAEAAPGSAPPEEKADEPPAPETLEASATGYGAEPPVVEDDPPAPPAPPAALDDMDKALEGLPADEAAKMKEFAGKHKLSPDVAKAYADLRKQELAAQEAALKEEEKAFAKEQLKQRAAWHKELKEDKDFGGDKYVKNVTMVDKVLTEFMPSTKKRLTETKAVMPPYLMRDLAKLGARLYETEKLVHGDPKPPKVDDESDDPLAFYE
jgi:hypothetical protein